MVAPQFNSITCFTPWDGTIQPIWFDFNEQLFRYVKSINLKVVFEGSQHILLPSDRNQGVEDMIALKYFWHKSIKEIILQEYYDCCSMMDSFQGTLSPWRDTEGFLWRTPHRHHCWLALALLMWSPFRWVYWACRYQGQHKIINFRVSPYRRSPSLSRWDTSFR